MASQPVVGYYDRWWRGRHRTHNSASSYLAMDRNLICDLSQVCEMIMTIVVNYHLYYQFETILSKPGLIFEWLNPTQRKPVAWLTVSRPGISWRLGWRIYLWRPFTANIRPSSPLLQSSFIASGSFIRPSAASGCSRAHSILSVWQTINNKHDRPAELGNKIQKNKVQNNN